MLQRQIANSTTKMALRSQSISSSLILRSSQLQSPVLIQQSKSYATKLSFSRKSSNDDKIKRKTPKKVKGGSIYSFAHTAAFSKLHKNAPPLSTQLPGTEIFDIQSVFPSDSLTPANPTIYQYSSKAVKSLYHLGSFKPDQKNELFKEKATLIRDTSSSQVLNIIRSGESTPSSQNRFVITGDKGVGKSTALAQAHAIAIEKGYIVLHVPYARDLLSGSYDTALAKKSRLPEIEGDEYTRVFNQPMYVKKLMRKFAKANEELLTSLSPSKEYVFEASRSFKQITFTPTDSTLYSMLKLGRVHIEKCEIFNAVLEELALQTKVPILFTMDDFNVFSHLQFAVNRDVNNNPIYHGELQIPRIFLDFISGSRTFKNGAILAALSSYKNGYTIPHGLGQAEPYPYAKFNDYDPILAGKLLANGGVKTLEVTPFSLDETEKVLQYYSNGQVFFQSITPSLIQQKYFLSGNGNPLALIKSCTEVY